MPLRLSHLMTLTISLTWVARFTLPSMRCERSPNPVIVGVNTLCPPFCRRSATRRQHQPPCQAPCTSTKVFGAFVCAGAGAAQSGRACAGPCACQHAAAGHCHLVGCSHRVLPRRRLLAQSYLGRVPSSRTARTENAWTCFPLPTSPGHPPPVDNRDNRPPSRQRPARAYTGRSSESLGPLHALSVPVPRRAARAASGFGGRRPARAAQEGGA